MLMTLNAYEEKCDFTHVTNGTTLNAYEGKGDSTHLTNEMTLNAYEGNGDPACRFERDGTELL